MIELIQILEEQKDLNTLCSTRPNLSHDTFAPNGHYGVSDIYKEYAGLPWTFSLNGIVPHGIELDPEWLWYEERISSASHVYCYPELRRRVYEIEANKKVILSASPFMYVVEMLKKQPKPQRRGTLLLPVHSTDHIRVQQDYDALANELRSLDAKYHPVCVCIYWKDYLMGADEPFRHARIPVVSAGHVYDRQFLYRLYHLFSQFQYVTSNGLGSHLFYAVKSGCSYFNISSGFELVAPQAVLSRDYSTKSTFSYQKDLKELFEPRLPVSTANQTRVVDYALGAKYFKSRRELKDDLLAARF